MLKTVKGPALFLAQFVDEKSPFNSLDGLCQWAADLGYKGIQIPTWVDFLIDLDKAAESQTYCDELKGKINSYGLEITELSTHLQGQLVAVHPAYDVMFDNFAPDKVKKQSQSPNSMGHRNGQKSSNCQPTFGPQRPRHFFGSLTLAHLASLATTS